LIDRLRLYSCGSSPRMWGTPSPRTSPGARRRFIPTHVGNTPKGRHYSIQPAVHPHACGEHRLGTKLRRMFDGSSPRMWGTRLSSIWGVKPMRFIPTHVGNTRAACACAVSCPVHPHACGEHLITNKDLVNDSGSSPRMWGTPVISWRMPTLLRFIPTHVGNTGGPAPEGRPPSVHPHACGEHTFSERRGSATPGSSPRMWGTPVFVVPRLVDDRFIPTHVGNTMNCFSVQSGIWVHPHACGEHHLLIHRPEF